MKLNVPATVTTILAYLAKTLANTDVHFTDAATCTSTLQKLSDGMKNNHPDALKTDHTKFYGWLAASMLFKQLANNQATFESHCDTSNNNGVPTDSGNLSYNPIGCNQLSNTNLGFSGLWASDIIPSLQPVVDWVELNATTAVPGIARGYNATCACPAPIYPNSQTWNKCHVSTDMPPHPASLQRAEL